jgi:multidrug transporter EmrE-like cation transporter
MKLALLILAALLFAFGGLCMKLSDGLTKPVYSISVFILFCVGAAIQAVAMKRADMGVVYIFVLGLEAIAAFLLSVVVAGERATPGRAGAVLLIVLGMVLLERT